MAPLYRLDCTAADVAARFGARAGDDPWAGGWVAPGKFAPVVTAGREFVAGPRPGGASLTPRVIPRLWGVLPPPSSNDPARRIATVRNPDSPFWIGNLRNSEFRCLVPVTAFMEWSETSDYEGRRTKRWLAPTGERLFAMAGVWKDEEVPAFALLVQAPNKGNRAPRPVIIPADGSAQQDWLHGDWTRARRLIDADPPPLAELFPE